MTEEELLRRVAENFKLLGDATRIKILHALMEGELCVHEIAWKVGASHSAVSHQLHLLRVAGIVKGRREGKEVKYSLSDDHIKEFIKLGLEHVKEG